MENKLHTINKPFDWTYHVTIKVRDKTIFQRRLDALLLQFVHDKWIRDFDVNVIDSTVIITFSGRTISNGVPTVYPNMVWDKIIYFIEDEVAKRYVEKYSYTTKIDNIEEAEKALEKAKEEIG